MVLRRFDAQVDRRPLGERPALVRCGRAKARLELRRKPLGEIPDNVGRRAGEVGSGEPRAFGFRELFRRVPLAGEERGDRLDVEVAHLPERAERFGARTWLAHDPGGRAFLTQRVVDQARYRRPVARASEAVREAPVLHCIGRRPATRIDIGQNFDRGGGAGGGGHGKGDLWEVEFGSATHRGAKPLVWPRPQFASDKMLRKEFAISGVTKSWSALTVRRF